MFEINDRYRLVRLKGQGEQCWMAEELELATTSFKRAIWKPVSRLLTPHQAENWLITANASDCIKRQFKAASETIQ